LYLIKHHAMATYWGNGGIALRIPNLGEAFHPGKEPLVPVV